MKHILNYCAYCIDKLLKIIKQRSMNYRITFYTNIHPTVSLGADVKLIGPYESFIIGEGTYINDAMLSTSTNSKISIGKRCSIGYRVSIKALTHDVDNPCLNDDGVINIIESDIIIGNFCWIGDNVYIREGVSLGDNIIVGANSVVTKSFPNDVIIAGVPAKIISTK